MYRLVFARMRAVALLFVLLHIACDFAAVSDEAIAVLCKCVPQCYFVLLQWNYDGNELAPLEHCPTKTHRMPVSIIPPTAIITCDIEG